MGGKSALALSAVLIGATITVVTTTLAIFLFLALANHTLQLPLDASNLSAVQIYLMATWVVVTPFAVGVGLVCHVILMAQGRTKLLHYMCTGALAGAVTTICMSFTIAYAPLGAIIGGATAAIAWLIRRPDRDADSSVIPDSAKR